MNRARATGTTSSAGRAGGGPRRAHGRDRGWAGRGWRALTAVAAAGIVAVGGVAAAAPDATLPSGQLAGDCAQDGTVRTGAIFNNPHTGDNARIHEHIVCMIDGAAPGSRIRIATYHFADRSILDALRRAVVDRQVRVQVIVDGRVPDHADDGPLFRELRDLIGGDRDDESWIAPCPGPDRACIADRKMHDKLITFSNTHDVANVTFVTSSNLEDERIAPNSGTDMWNSGYTAADDAPLYDWFANTYFEDLATANPENLDYYEDRNLPRRIGNHGIYHSPRRDGNTVLDILDKVECHGNTSGGTDPGHRTIVRVAMWAITKSGGVGTRIAKRLWDLDNEGCYVDVVADVIDYDADAGTDPLRTLLDKPRPTTGTNYHGPEVREFNSTQPHGLHEKNLLIDGGFDGRINQKIVFTGSYNFTQSSAGDTSSFAVNDETWLRIDDPGVHDRFRDNFFLVRDAAHTCWQTSKQDGCGGGRDVDSDPQGELNCHETADKYRGAGNVYLYGGTYCDGAHGAKDGAEVYDEPHYGDGAGAITDFDNRADSIVNTTDRTIEFYNYPNFNAGHPEGDRFCLRPDQWINRISKYGDGHNSWSNSISSHRAVDPGDCDRWFGGYHEPNR